jgi:hypothetical protein
MNERRKRKIEDAKHLYEMGLMDRSQYEKIKNQLEANDQWVGPVVIVLIVISIFLSHYWSS